MVRARIRGGRSWVRAQLYMAASHARKYNPAGGEFYRRVVSRSEPSKPAMTACMRKPLVLMNTLVVRDRRWDPSHATSLAFTRSSLGLDGEAFPLHVTRLHVLRQSSSDWEALGASRALRRSLDLPHHEPAVIPRRRKVSIDRPSRP